MNIIMFFVFVLLNLELLYNLIVLVFQFISGSDITESALRVSWSFHLELHDLPALSIYLDAANLR